MLTQQDLSAIEGLLERKLESKLEEKLEKKFSVFESKLDAKLESKLEEKLEKKFSVFENNLDAKLESKLAPVKKDIRKMQKDLSTAIELFSEEDSTLHRRMDRVETVLGLPALA